MNYIVGLLKTKTARANVMMPLFAELFPTADASRSRFKDGRSDVRGKEEFIHYSL